MSNINEFTGETTPSFPFWHDFPDIGIKKWIIISSALFLFGLLIGTINAGSYSTDNLVSLGGLAETIGTLTTTGSLIFIIINNVIKLIMSFIFSPILCFMPILSLVVNGWVLAYVGYFVIEQYSLGFYIMGILPHGILEIPALVLGQAAALSFGAMAMAAFIKKDKRAVLLNNLRINIKYLGIAVLLLIPAAIIEIYITPVILNNL